MAVIPDLSELTEKSGALNHVSGGASLVRIPGAKQNPIDGEDPWSILTTMLIKPIKSIDSFINGQTKSRLSPEDSFFMLSLRNTAF